MFFTKAWNFIKKNAFYIGLVVCVLAIGTISVIASLPQPEDDPSEIVDNTQGENLKDAQEQRDDEAKPSKDALSGEASKSPEPTKTSNTAKTNVNRGSATVSLTKPLEGEIITSFSGETLVFNSTVNMWMTHNGIDISAENNTEVVAALPGEVSSVVNDDSKGKIVEITHTNGAKTLYAGLSEADVEEGSKVNAGQKIGTAGTPAFESDKGPHLHFEYSVEGKFKDPTEYFA